MPINKILPTRRAKQAIAAVVVAAGVGAGGWGGYSHQPAPAPAPIHRTVVTPAMEIRAAIDKGYVPPAVRLAVDYLIRPWEGLVLHSHWDRFSKRYDICFGDTLIDGKPVKAGMTLSKERCEAILIQRVIYDYYLPLVDGVPGYIDAPISLQASMISGAYNFGVDRQKHSKTAEFVGKRRYHDACLAQTAFNKSGGQRLDGLVKRRENGDIDRIGEAELCVSGLVN